MILALWAATAQAQSFADLVKTHALTATDERRVGELTFNLTTGFLPTVDDPEVVSRVETVLQRVIRASDRPGQIVKLRVIDDPTLNAAAYPGGYLLVHKGAVDAFEPDELAFVLAHELAHVQLRHYANGQNLSTALSQLSEVERARGGTFEEADRETLFGVQKLLAHYGRQLEFEADLYGLLFLVRAGRPAEAALSAMDKLAALETQRQAHVLDGHPTAIQRKADLIKGLDALRHTHLKFEQGIAAMQAGRTDDAVPAFEDFLSVFPRSGAAWTNLAAAHHGQVLASHTDPWFERIPLQLESGVVVRGVESGRAYDAAQRALTLDPNNAQALAILSSLARLAGHREQASTLLDRAELCGLDATTVAVNRGVIEGGEAGLRRWQALADDPFAIANRAVWHQQNEQPAMAERLWATLQNTQLHGAAELALGRTFPNGPPTTLGPIALGAPLTAFEKSYGTAPVRQEADLGGFYEWPDRGVAAYTYADRVQRVHCRNTCDWTYQGVGVGAAGPTVVAKLGPAQIFRTRFSGEQWVYTEHGLTLAMASNHTVLAMQMGSR